MTKVAFIGAGQMARALACGFIAVKKVAASSIQICDPSSDAVAGFQSAVPDAMVASSSKQCTNDCDVVFIAVKPQHIDSVFNQVERNSSCLFVSIVAGVSLDRLSGGLKSTRIVRVMPNTPCLVGKGASGFSPGAGATQDDADLVGELLESVGIAFQLPESQLDAVTGLSGSGPAFVYQLVEALSDGGVRVGLPRDVATKLAAQTVLGASQMVIQTGDHPGVLKDRVTSPGGTTIAGLHALESGGFRASVIDAVVAATNRSTELGAG